MIGYRCSLDADAWSATFRPAPSESSTERQARIARQQEAARTSREIDDGIERARKLHEKRKRAIKVLLLGQAESGKSTMLRNFQLAFCPTYFHREAPVWKIVIQLNLIGSVKKLLGIIEDELDVRPLSSPPSRTSFRSGQSTPSSERPTSSRPLSDPASSTRASPGPSDPPLTHAHSALRLRLLPLLNVETKLARQLLPEFGGISPPLPSASGWAKWASGASDDAANGCLFGNGEICVRAGGAWKTVLEHVTRPPRHTPDSTPDSPPESISDRALAQPIAAAPPPVSTRPPPRAARRHPSDPTPLLEALAPDVHALWTDPAMRALLKRRGFQMEHSAGFFLNDVLRIGQPGWTPGIDDIVRARLRTFGVEEHRFAVENGQEWYIYDVGGSRGSRHQWVPYFDDVQAIIFLAPLVFNQMLDEDKKINRLEDSVSLWKEVCASPLLAAANIILFLNKMDILQSTLDAGVRVQTYVPTYGSRPNETEHVVKYFRDMFRSYHKRLSPKQRTFFCHETSAIDTAATQTILFGVREGILRSHLERLRVI